MTFRIPDDVLAAHMEGEAVLLNMATKRYFQLNDTGQRVWQLLESMQDADAIAAVLCDEFEIDRATAGAEVRRLLREFAALGVVDEQTP